MPARGQIIPPEDRFWPKVREQDCGYETPCWLWMGHQSDGRYGHFGLGGVEKIMAHRFAYEYVVGKIPVGFTIDHLCKIIVCVNPAHLDPVTMLENIRRSNSPAGINYRKTHCKRGHPLSGDNLLPSKNGWRRCKTCARDQAREEFRRRTGAKPRGPVTSRLRGVHRKGMRWVANGNLNGRTVYLGTFDSEEAAGEAAATFRRSRERIGADNQCQEHR